VNTPERLYSPLILAQTAKAMEIDAAIYFLGMAITVMKHGEAEKIKVGNFPNLKQVIDQTMAAGVEFYICEASCQLIGRSRRHNVVLVRWIDSMKVYMDNASSAPVDKRVIEDMFPYFDTNVGNPALHQVVRNPIILL